MPKIPFTKMHGCGNDYIYVDASSHPIADPSACAVAWSDRHKGIGSDGLVLIDRSPVPEADFSMRIFNADGSEAMMCGNASRCIGKYLYERKKETHPWPLPKSEVGGHQETALRLLTLSGIKTLHLHIINNIVASVTVDMGEPVFEDETLFIPSLDGRLSAPLHHSEGQGGGSFISMGNPHYVVFTDDIDQVGETGPVLEQHPAFPRRCNIEFAKIIGGDMKVAGGDLQSPTTIRTRVWERGSGITQACGTGACATAVAACLTGRAGRTSDIVMDGGTLHIEWRETDNHVYMTGPAAFAFDGEAELPDNRK